MQIEQWLFSRTHCRGLSRSRSCERWQGSGLPPLPFPSCQDFAPGISLRLPNSCLDPGANWFMVRTCRHGRNLKLASQRKSAAARLWAMGSVAAPAQSPSVILHVWVPQAALLAQVPWHHHHHPPWLHVRSRAYPRFPLGIIVSHRGGSETSLDTKRCRSRTVGAEGGLGSSPLQLGTPWRGGKSRRDVLFPSVQKCRQTEREARDLSQDKWSFPYILKIICGVFFTLANKTKALHYKLN